MLSYIRAKNNAVLDPMFDALKILKNAGVNIGFGTDLIADLHPYQNQEFALRAKVFEPVDILRQATSVNASLIAMSGKKPQRSPLGVIREGAAADLLLVKDNPVNNIMLMTQPDKSFSLIMKGGIIVKSE